MIVNKERVWGSHQYSLYSEPTWVLGLATECRRMSKDTRVPARIPYWISQKDSRNVTQSGSRSSPRMSVGSEATLTPPLLTEPHSQVASHLASPGVQRGGQSPKALSGAALLIH